MSYDLIIKSNGVGTSKLKNSPFFAILPELCKKNRQNTMLQFIVVQD